MGGNALKNTETRRYTADEYHEMVVFIKRMLYGRFPGIEFDVIKSYTNKESFGDMDILIKSDTIPSNWVDLIRSGFAPNEMVKNGKCLSFDCRGLQIDLIVCKPEEYVTSFYYFAYNDLGNLMGRLANSMGLKLGHDGLSYSWREEGTTYVYRTEVISTDWEVILTVLGLDISTYYDGFETMEDIFEFVASSPFFSPNIYLFENRNNAGRTRDAKRPTYNAFLDWCDTNKSRLPDHPKTHRDAWLMRCFHYIPGFQERYVAVNLEWMKDAAYKKKFNGNLVSEWTGLTGKELGIFMKWLKDRRTCVTISSIEDEARWKEWVVDDGTDIHTIGLVINSMFRLFIKERVYDAARSPA